MILQLLEFVVPIALLIILHEFGHFLANKAVGIEVEEFGLGFPPRAKELFTYKGTMYSLNWLPFGGFVRAKGEGDPTIEGGLMAAGPWKRIAVFLAGPAMNLIAAVLLFSGLFAFLGVPDQEKVLVVGVDEGSPAQLAGMLDGDIVTKINDTTINDSETFSGMIQANIGQEMDMTLQRGDEYIVITMVPRENPPAGQGAVGMVYSHPFKTGGVGEVLVQGANAAYQQARMIISIPGMLLRGSENNGGARLLGYKGMFDGYFYGKEAAAEEGLSPLVNAFNFFAMVSMSLGILNLMPIPAVDGGRILFAIPEILFKKRIPTEFENIVNFVSFSLLLLLLIYINVQDFINPVQF